MPKVDVSIIIVFYSGKEKLLECLKSIKEHKTKYVYEVIVVNNGNEKIEHNVKKAINKAVYIKSSKNGGYGYGNNLGAEKAKGKYLFILNPDTKVLPKTLDVLNDFLNKHKDVAIAAPTLLDEKREVFKLQGTENLTPLRAIFALSFLNTIFPNNHISKNYWLLNTNIHDIREVGTVPGTAFMIQKDVFEKVGRFDENMFLFFEEADLGKRVQEAGYKIIMHPDATVIHAWSNRKKGDEKMGQIAAKSRFHYFKKHYGMASAVFVEAFTRFSKRKAIIAAVILLVVLLLYI
jgi:GT2 family glycosyltransferase